MNFIRRLFSSFLIRILITCVQSGTSEVNFFPLTILHINDFHSRYDPITTKGGDCDETKERCIGGLARIIHTIRRFKRDEWNKNVLYLNAGDNYQGTLFYNIGLWNVTSQLMNLEPPDYMILGNHEFDNSIPGIVPFLERIKSQVLIANVDDSEEPDMQKKYSWTALTTFHGWKEKVGIIGLIMSNANIIANTRKLKFLQESKVVIQQAKKLKKEGAAIIVVITHIGYDVDQRLANETAQYIDIIVGGHSHSFLYTGDDYPAFEKPEGPYPTIVEVGDNRVLIVQAGCHGKHVGHLTVYFDKKGKVHHYQGNPIYMGTDVPQDKAIKKAIKPWKEIVDSEGSRVIGYSKRELLKDNCRTGECELGNFFADALINVAGGNKELCNSKDIWANASVALLNAGAIKTSMPQGNWTYAQLVAFSPYDNFIIECDLLGKYIREALDYATTLLDAQFTTKKRTRLLHFSGLKVIYDMSQPIHSRVKGVTYRKKTCPYSKYEKLKDEVTYRIITTDYLLSGGDGFHMFLHATDKKVYKILSDALMDYLKVSSPINPQLEERIKILNMPKM